MLLSVAMLITHPYERSYERPELPSLERDLRYEPELSGREIDDSLPAGWPFEPPLAPPPSPTLAPSDPPAEEEGVVLRRWGTSTTDWRHENRRCVIVLFEDETLVVTCRGEELFRAFVPCAPDHASCASPDDDSLRADFERGYAALRVDDQLRRDRARSPAPVSAASAAEAHALTDCGSRRRG